MSDFKYKFRVGSRAFFGNTDQEILDSIANFYTQRQIEIDINEFAPLVRKSKAENIQKITNQGDTITAAKRELKFHEIISGAKAILKNELGLTASQEEINRRAIICTGCKLVTDVSGCKACGAGKSIAQWMDKMSGVLSKFRKAPIIPNSLGDKYCDHCGCSLYIMLPSEMSNFNEPNNVTRPKHCWANPLSPNYVP